LNKLRPHTSIHGRYSHTSERTNSFLTNSKQINRNTKRQVKSAVPSQVRKLVKREKIIDNSKETSEIFDCRQSSAKMKNGFISSLLKLNNMQQQQQEIGSEHDELTSETTLSSHSYSIERLKHTPITVDTSRARSNLEVLRLCINELGWQENSSGDDAHCDIIWQSCASTNESEQLKASTSSSSAHWPHRAARVNKFPCEKSKLMTKTNDFLTTIIY
jgi:hypothetical protein